MAKGGGRKYARDKNGRFASTGGGGSKPGRAMASAVGKAEKQRSNRAAAVDKMPNTAGGKRPKTAAGRASANLRAANAGGLDRKAMRSARTAQRALDYYKANGGGRKGAAKPAPKSTAGKGTAAARGAVIRAKAKAGANPTRGQKAAITKAINRLKVAKAENTSAKNMRRPKMAGTISRPKRGRK